MSALKKLKNWKVSIPVVLVLLLALLTAIFAPMGGKASAQQSAPSATKAVAAQPSAATSQTAAAKQWAATTAANPDLLNVGSPNDPPIGALSPNFPDLYKPAMNAVSAAKMSPMAFLPVSRGIGFWADGVWFGTYINNGLPMYCITPGLNLTTGQYIRALSVYPPIGALSSYEMEFVLAHWGVTGNAVQAAAVRDAILVIRGINLNAANFLPASIRTLAGQMVAQARVYTGPYSVSMHVDRNPLIGQSGPYAGVADVSVIAAVSHRAVPNVLVNLSAINATVPRTVSTGPTGVVHFNFVKNTTTTGAIYAQAVNLAPLTMWASLPAYGQKQLVQSNGLTTASNHVAFNTSANGPRATYSCTTVCNGHPPVTVTFCAAPYVATGRYVVKDNGRIVAVVQINRSTVQQCKTVMVVSTDRHVVTFAVTYYWNGRWTPYIALPGVVRIDCPPWPVVTANLQVCCKGSFINVGLGANTSGHFERLVWTVNGVKHVLQSNPGHAAIVVHIATSATSKTAVTATGLVQRADLHWVQLGVSDITAPATGVATVI